MKRILVYSEAWGFGGIEAFLMGVFRQLSQKGFLFTLFTVWDWNTSYDTELDSLGIERIVLFKGYRPGQIKRLREGIAAFSRLLEKTRFDVVHVNTMNGMGLSYVRVAKACDVPIRIAHSHNSDVGEGAKSIKRIVHRGARFAFAGEATVRLSCSTEAGRHLFGKKPFIVVHNGFDTSRFSFDTNKRETCRREFGIPEGTLLFGNPSRLAPAKNPLFQLKVFSEVLKCDSSARYLMQGAGELEQEVKELACELGVTNSIVWFDPRPDPECLYSAMDAMLFPSYFEGLSLASIEAQASGLPVLLSSDVSRDTAVTNLVKFESLDAPASTWAKELIGLARKHRKRFGYAAQVRAAGYDASDTAKIVAKVYGGEAR